MDAQIIWDGKQEGIAIVRKALREYLVSLRQLPCWNETISPVRNQIVARILLNEQAINIKSNELGPEIIRCKLQQASGKRSLNASLKRMANHIGRVLIVIGITLFPKCAFCWGIYFSFLASIGVSLPYMPYMLPVLYCLFGLNIFLIIRKNRSLVLSSVLPVTAGSIILICYRQFTMSNYMVYVAGLVLVFSGIITDLLLSKKLTNKLGSYGGKNKRHAR